MQIKNKFTVEGFQNFEKFPEINIVNIKITNSEIQNSLLFYARKYKYRFIANSLLFSSSLKTDTNTIFITTNGLNDAKELLINGKLFQGIGVIFTSEINHWKDIKKDSHWTNTVLTDSQNPIAANHFSFGFEATDLHNLLNFKYSLIDDRGKLLQAKQGGDKIPALNFSIQIA